MALQREALCPASPQAIQVIVVALGWLILSTHKIGAHGVNFMRTSPNQENGLFGYDYGRFPHPRARGSD